MACGLSQNDVLFVEAIFPPLRDTKRFPPLEIQKILAETNELRAEIRHWIYCEQDVLKSKSSFTQSPFGLDFFFMRPGERLTKTELATFSRLADLHVETSYEPCCPVSYDRFLMKQRKNVSFLAFVKFSNAGSSRIRWTRILCSSSSYEIFRLQYQ